MVPESKRGTGTALAVLGAGLAVLGSNLEVLDISPKTADRVWAFARAWLHRELAGTDANAEA